MKVFAEKKEQELYLQYDRKRELLWEAVPKLQKDIEKKMDFLLKITTALADVKITSKHLQEIVDEFDKIKF